MLKQILAAWALLAVPTAWFSYREIKATWHIKRISVLNFVPLIIAAALLGARWPLTAVERAAKYLARLDQ